MSSIKLIYYGLFVLLTVSCSKIKESDKTPSGETKQTPEDVFVNIAGFPSITDTIKFINDLNDHCNQSHHRNVRILNYRKITLYGSDDSLIFFEYEWGFGSGADFPWKNQFLFSMDGKRIGRLNAMRYEFRNVFPNEDPLLLAVFSTYHGNGWHKLYKIKADSLENIYDGVSDWFPRTYDGHEDIMVNEPTEFNLTFADYNADGYNDMAFKGKFVLIMGYSKDIGWYDIQIRKDSSKVPYSIDNPFDKIPVEMFFLYNPETGHFVQKEDYSRKYLNRFFPDQE